MPNTPPPCLSDTATVTSTVTVRVRMGNVGHGNHALVKLVTIYRSDRLSSGWEPHTVFTLGSRSRSDLGLEQGGLEVTMGAMPELAISAAPRTGSRG